MKTEPICHMQPHTDAGVRHVGSTGSGWRRRQDSKMISSGRSRVHHSSLRNCALLSAPVPAHSSATRSHPPDNLKAFAHADPPPWVSAQMLPPEKTLLNPGQVQVLNQPTTSLSTFNLKWKLICTGYNHITGIVPSNLNALHYLKWQ